METKPCQQCGKQFERDPRITQATWEKRRYCSRQCYGQTRRAIKICKNCGKEYRRIGSKGVGAVYCSTECAYADRIGQRRGPDHWAWKGGRRTAAGGYIEVALPDEHPYASMRRNERYVMEHRLTMAEHLGRPLEANETVHHVNGDRADNRLENLQLRQGRHGNGVAYRCRACGSTDVEAITLT